MLVVPDLEDVFVPSREDLFVDAVDSRYGISLVFIFHYSRLSRHLLEPLLTSIMQRDETYAMSESALGSALYRAVHAVSP